MDYKVFTLIFVASNDAWIWMKTSTAFFVLHNFHPKTSCFKQMKIVNWFLNFKQNLNKTRFKSQNKKLWHDEIKIKENSMWISIFKFPRGISGFLLQWNLCNVSSINSINSVVFLNLILQPYTADSHVHNFHASIKNAMPSKESRGFTPMTTHFTLLFVFIFRLSPKACALKLHNFLEMINGNFLSNFE